jgi:hypothetical protein
MPSVNLKNRKMSGYCESKFTQEKPKLNPSNSRAVAGSKTMQNEQYLLQLQRLAGNQAVYRMLHNHIEKVSGQSGSQTREKVSKASATRKSGKRQPAFELKIISESTDVYDVEGDSLSDVHNQLPTDWGHMEYKIEPPNSLIRDGIIVGLTFNLSLQFKMPRWIGPTWKKAGPAVKKEWRRMLGALWIHENGHKKILINFCHELETELIGVKEEELQDKLKEQFDRHQLLQNDYDLETDRGKKQGVFLDLTVA